MQAVFNTIVERVLKALMKEGLSERRAKECCRANIDFLEKSYIDTNISDIVDYLLERI